MNVLTIVNVMKKDIKRVKWEGNGTHKIPKLWSPKQGRHKDDISQHANTGGGNLTGSHPDEELQAINGHQERISLL